MTDTIRDQLWATVYAEQIRAGVIWLDARAAADQAVFWYDKRPAPLFRQPSTDNTK